MKVNTITADSDGLALVRRRDVIAFLRAKGDQYRMFYAQFGQSRARHAADVLHETANVLESEYPDGGDETTETKSSTLTVNSQETHNA